MGVRTAKGQRINPQGKARSAQTRSPASSEGVQRRPPCNRGPARAACPASCTKPPLFFSLVSPPHKDKAAARLFHRKMGALLLPLTFPQATVLVPPPLDSSPLPQESLRNTDSKGPGSRSRGEETGPATRGRRLPGWTAAGAARRRSCAWGSDAEGLSPRKAPEAEAEATRPTRLNMAESGWRLSAAAVPAAGPAVGARPPLRSAQLLGEFAAHLLQGRSYREKGSKLLSHWSKLVPILNAFF